MATRTFEGSKEIFGYGYYAYADEGTLFIGEDWIHGGRGLLYKGPYSGATKYLEELRNSGAEKLYNNIVKYFEGTESEELQCSIEPESLDLFKVILYMSNGSVFNGLVRDISKEAACVQLTPKTPTALCLTTLEGNDLIVWSDKIIAIEFLNDY